VASSRAGWGCGDGSVILNVAKDLALLWEEFFERNVRSFAALRTTDQEAYRLVTET